MKEMMKLSNSALLVVISVIISVLIYNWNLFFNHSFKTESSVWCLKSLNDTKLCTFKNICYDTYFRTFLFFLGKETVIKGLENYTEFQKIQLSSINIHNKFYMNISIMDTENYKINKLIKTETKALLISRFKPNNIMHSIHDDLFPVFLTLESVCLGDRTCMENYNLVFHDHYPPGPFFNLYKIFSKWNPILLNKLSSDSELLCFRELLTGLVKDSIFYQYGFIKPHGPIKPSQLNQNDVLKFTSFIKNKLKISDNEKNKEVVLFSRNKNRKILNVKKVEEMLIGVLQKLKKKYKVKVIELDLFVNDTVGVIKLLSQAEVLLGMHGAEMIFSLFMKPKSAVFELFPYGIQPEIVSFIKSVSEIEDSHTMHFPWRNIHKNNSVAHQHAHPHFGGISYLDKNIQEKIKNTQVVPAVECCNNPVFLYHMYQDTYVSNEFKQFFLESISKFYNYQKKEARKKWFYPYIVFNISCYFEVTNRLLQITWLPPFNLNKVNDLKYSLYVKDQRGVFNKEIITDKLSVKAEIPETVGNGPKFLVWIAVYDGYTRSPDLHFEC